MVRIYVALLMIGWGLMAHGQVKNSWESRWNVAAGWSFGSASIGLRQEVRFNHSQGQIKYFFSELQPGWSPWPWLNIEPGVRFYEVANDRNQWRYLLDISGRHNLIDSVLFLNWRQRLQQEDLTNLDEPEPETVWRPRVGLTQVLSPRLALTADAEFFYRFDQVESWIEWRRGLSLTYRWSRRLRSDLFYLLDRSWNQVPIERVHAVGLYNTFSW